MVIGTNKQTNEVQTCVKGEGQDTEQKVSQTSGSTGEAMGFGRKWER